MNSTIGRRKPKIVLSDRLLLFLKSSKAAKQKLIAPTTGFSVMSVSVNTAEKNTKAEAGWIPLRPTFNVLFPQRALKATQE